MKRDPYEPEEFWKVLTEQERHEPDLEHDFRVDRAREVSDDPGLAWPGVEAAEVAG